MDIIQLIMSIPQVGPYLVYVGIIVAAAASFAPFLPGPTDVSSRGYRMLYAVVAWCALHKGHALALAAPGAPAKVLAGDVPGTAIEKVMAAGTAPIPPVQSATVMGLNR